MSRNIRGRLDRLERKTDAGPPQIDWDNFCCRREDIVPDGVIDWDEMFVRSEITDPFEELIYPPVFVKSNGSSG